LKANPPEFSLMRVSIWITNAVTGVTEDETRILNYDPTHRSTGEDV